MEVAKSDLSFSCYKKLDIETWRKKLLHSTAMRTMNFIGVKWKNAEKLEPGFSYYPNIIVNETNVSDHRIIAPNRKINGFNNRLENVNSHTESDSSENKKD